MSVENIPTPYGRKPGPLVDSRHRIPLASGIPFFFFNDTATTEIYTLSLHDALPIWCRPWCRARVSQCQRNRRPRGRCRREFPSPDHVWSTRPSRPSRRRSPRRGRTRQRSEEHTSELQSPCNLVCRLLLEKKNHHSIRGFLSLATTSAGQGVIAWTGTRRCGRRGVRPRPATDTPLQPVDSCSSPDVSDSRH